MSEALESGFYADQNGQQWHCVNHRGEQRMICHSGSSMTVANYPTFRRWGWKPVSDKPIMEGK